MEIDGPDIVGFVGVAFIVATYFLSQIGRMNVNQPLYPALNAVGAIFILFSLAYSFNPASFVIELFWLAISAVGLVRTLVAGRAVAPARTLKNNHRDDESAIERS